MVKAVLVAAAAVVMRAFAVRVVVMVVVMVVVVVISGWQALVYPLAAVMIRVTAHMSQCLLLPLRRSVRGWPPGDMAKRTSQW
jgi:hypothetical protein